MNAKQVERMIPQAEQLVALRREELEEAKKAMEAKNQAIAESMQFVADLKSQLAELRGATGMRGRRVLATRRATPTSTPSGPSLNSVQGEAVDAMEQGRDFTVRDLFQWCLEAHPGRWTEAQMPGFASMFAKRRASRDDILTIHSSRGSEPAIYRKVPPNQERL